MERNSKNHHHHLQFSEEIPKKWIPAEAKSLAQGPPSLHGPEEETRRERLRRLMLGGAGWRRDLGYLGMFESHW